MTTVENYEALQDLIEEDYGRTRVLAFRDRNDDAVLIFCDEEGDLGYQMVPTEEEEDRANGWAGNDTLAWPLRLLVVEAEEVR